MKNFIPIDFFTGNKTRVYTSKSGCTKSEGSAIEFDSIKIDLSISKIIDNKIIIDSIKEKEKKDIADAKKAVDISLKEKKDALKLKIKDKSAKLEDVIAILEILLDE